MVIRGEKLFGNILRAKYFKGQVSVSKSGLRNRVNVTVSLHGGIMANKNSKVEITDILH